MNNIKDNLNKVECKLNKVKPPLNKVKVMLDKDKKYVIGPRNAWDTVPIGLFDSYGEALKVLPIGSSPKIIREATELEVTSFSRKK